jgi:hypothetical protein
MRSWLAARVLARKHRARDEWLLCAWAAAGGDREVAATIPALGEVKLLARATGAVYRAAPAEGRPQLTLADTDGRLPTAAMGK